MYTIINEKSREFLFGEINGLLKVIARISDRSNCAHAYQLIKVGNSETEQLQDIKHLIFDFINTRSENNFDGNKSGLDKMPSDTINLEELDKKYLKIWFIDEFEYSNKESIELLKFLSWLKEDFIKYLRSFFNDQEFCIYVWNGLFEDEFGIFNFNFNEFFQDLGNDFILTQNKEVYILHFGFMD